MSATALLPQRRILQQFSNFHYAAPLVCFRRIRVSSRQGDDGRLAAFFFEKGVMTEFRALFAISLALALLGLGVAVFAPQRAPPGAPNAVAFPIR